MPVLKNFLKIATSQWRRLGAILTAFSQDQKTFSNKDDGSLGHSDGHGTMGGNSMIIRDYKISSQIYTYIIDTKYH
jgi:hypothetical protein